MNNDMMLHPFFSFVPKSSISLINNLSKERIRRLNGPDVSNSSTDWLRIKTNNFGFFSPYDYPISRKEGSFILGVLGGSVASWFAIQRGHSLSRRFGTSRIAMLCNLANGGFKQPQQCFALQYFLLIGQRFDAVLEIDGFNEAALAWDNMEHGIDQSMPSRAYMDMILPRGKRLFMKRVDQSQSDDSSRWKTICDLCVQSIRIMHQICSLHAIPFIHVLQPNQYHCKKSFGESERAIALSETSPYRRAVESIYPHLKLGIEELRHQGVNSIDATGLFDRIEDVVFSDNCCHYNNLGNALLEDMVVDAISAIL